MAKKARTFVIAGAGVAGLTLALSLAKFGATVIVLERHDTIQEFGAGLQISPNARRILDRLGVGRILGARAFEPEALDVYRLGAETPLASMRFGAAARDRFGAPYAVMHRADLVQSLYQACKRFANIDILFGVRSFDLAAHARGLTVSIEEAAGKSRRVRPFAFIGADGVHSFTRTEFVDGPQARYSGLVAWRALVPLAAMDGVLDPANSALVFGPGFHTVIYPLPHRDMANIVVLSKLTEKRARTDLPPGPIKASNAIYQSPKLAPLIAAAEDDWTRWPLNAVHTHTWHAGDVGLIGDAAHAMLPFQAQGAAMAIEDAAILAPLLITEPKAADAFARYQALRLPRVEKVMNLSARNGRIFHMRWPLSMGRDMVLAGHGPTAHLDRLAWLYGYDPAPDPALPLPGHTEKVS